jgi:hypothetical protein
MRKLFFCSLLFLSSGHLFATDIPLDGGTFVATPGDQSGDNLVANAPTIINTEDGSSTYGNLSNIANLDLEGGNTLTLQGTYDTYNPSCA